MSKEKLNELEKRINRIEKIIIYIASLMTLGAGVDFFPKILYMLASLI